MNEKQGELMDIGMLVRQFQTRVLPKTLWTHQAHIQVAFWYNWHYPFAEALPLVRAGIRNYNEAVGTPNTDESGYHETLTVYWMRVTRSFLADHPEMVMDQALAAFLKTEDSRTSSPFRYYTKELLFSKAARHQWVDGDLQPVPTLKS